MAEENQDPLKPENHSDPVPATPPEHHDVAQKNHQKPDDEKEKEKDGSDENKKTSDDVNFSVPEEKSVPTIVQKIADLAAIEKHSEEKQAEDRDVILARVENEKRLALIKAWEESEKTKSENKAYKNLSAVAAWENRKRADVEAQLKKVEEKFEKKKAEYAEKIKNKMADVHKIAEEKRALVDATRREECLQVEEKAAKYRATGFVPRKLLACFGS